jgi:hypothetical protein
MMRWTIDLLGWGASPGLADRNHPQSTAHSLSEPLGRLSMACSRRSSWPRLAFSTASIWAAVASSAMTVGIWRPLLSTSFGVRMVGSRNVIFSKSGPRSAISITLGKPSSWSVQMPQVVQPVGSFSSFSVKAVSADTQIKSMSGNLPSFLGTYSCQYSRLMMPPLRGTGAC